ncbi:MAG: hypothetical protein V3T21_05950 [Candidatus Margulisiibacteriota bacterium]
MSRVTLHSLKYVQSVGKNIVPRAKFAQNVRFICKKYIRYEDSFFDDFCGDLLLEILKRKNVIAQNVISLTALQFDQVLISPAFSLLQEIAHSFNSSPERPKQIYLEAKLNKLNIIYRATRRFLGKKLRLTKPTKYQNVWLEHKSEQVSEAITKIKQSVNGLSAQEIGLDLLPLLIDHAEIRPVLYFTHDSFSVRYFSRLQINIDLKNKIKTVVEGEAMRGLAEEHVDLNHHPLLIPVKTETGQSTYYMKNVFNALQNEARAAKTPNKYFILCLASIGKRHWIHSQDADKLVAKSEYYYALEPDLFEFKREFVIPAKIASEHIPEIFTHRLDYLLRLRRAILGLKESETDPHAKLIESCARFAIINLQNEKFKGTDEFVLSHAFAVAFKTQEWGGRAHAVCAALLHVVPPKLLETLSPKIGNGNFKKIRKRCDNLLQSARQPFWLTDEADVHFMQNSIYETDQKLSNLDDLLTFFADKLNEIKRMTYTKALQEKVPVILEATFLLATMAEIHNLKKPFEEFLDAAFFLADPKNAARIKMERDKYLHRSPEKLTPYLEGINNLFLYGPENGKKKNIKAFWRIKGLYQIFMKLLMKKKTYPTLKDLPDPIAYTILTRKKFASPEEVQFFIDETLAIRLKIDREKTAKMREDKRYKTKLHDRTGMWHIYVMDKHDRRMEFQVGTPSIYKKMTRGKLRHWVMATERRQQAVPVHLRLDKEMKKLEVQEIDTEYYDSIADSLRMDPKRDFPLFRKTSNNYIITTSITPDGRVQKKRLERKMDGKEPTIEDLAATRGIDLLGGDYYGADTGFLQQDQEGWFQVVDHKNCKPGEKLVSGGTYRFKRKKDGEIENPPLSYDEKLDLRNKVQRFRALVYLFIKKSDVESLAEVGRAKLEELTKQSRLSKREIMNIFWIEEKVLCAACSQPPLFELASARLAALTARKSEDPS